MADVFDQYLDAINKALAGGDATEHTHRPALKVLVEALGEGITAVNEPRRIACGAPDLRVARTEHGTDQTLGYVECKDIGTNLVKEARSEQVKKRYLPSLSNFILTDYIEFRWYLCGEMQLTARLAHEETGGRFKATAESGKQVEDLLTAFLSQAPQRITTAKDLAERMAALARLLRDVIVGTFGREEPRGQLHEQLEAFRRVLIHDLTEEQFADMYAQTICYGLFTARCHIDPAGLRDAQSRAMDRRSAKFSRRDAGYLLPKTNPFLRKMFNQIAGPDLDDRITWVVDDIVALLDRAAMDEVLKGFARGSGGRDPVVHFYETFLGQYDPTLREMRGVYYTPEPVVRYIVRSVDQLLRKKFGLKRGLADNTTVKIPDGNGQTKVAHRCLILDPAVGTGTFLFEVIDEIHRRFQRQKGMWSGYVREHLLPRLFGFELMMAPYAVAHMKLGLQLGETGYDFESHERLGIYLTNTLEEASEVSQNVFAQWLSDEAREANNVKKNLPIMVVLGNPPYSGVSANQGRWINALVDSYREADGGRLGEKKVWLKNDYVKFMRFAQWRIERTGAGILAFITDHSYLDSPTFRGMRERLLGSFDEIYILNLHGNKKRRETAPDGGEDQNVFDITQGVAIGIFVKNGTHRQAEVRYADLWGKRDVKYKFLTRENVERTSWKRIHPKSPFHLFVPADGSMEAQYREGWKITDICRVGSNGVQTSRDELVVAFTPEELRTRLGMFLDKRQSDDEIRSRFFSGKGGMKYLPGDTRGWSLAEARSTIRENRKWPQRIARYAYRPFDDRVILYMSEVIDWPRPQVMQHFGRRNRGLCVGRAGLVQADEWDLVYCMQIMCDHNLFRRGSSMNMPLYIYPNGSQQDMDYESWPRGEGGRVPNLSREFVEELARRVKLAFVADGRGDLRKTFGPEDVFEYIYAVLHSPEYRRRYAEFLKIDFPRIPWPNGRADFRELCRTGRRLTALHLMEADVLEDDKRWPLFPKEGGMAVEAGYPRHVVDAERPAAGRVYINKDQYFEGVPPVVWQFHVGGYRVCEKWLKDRRGRTLSYGEVNHYQKVVVAISETLRLVEADCMGAL
ncbi:MAG TPA: DNA methyltransferase [Phycisphaerales bacterium]|nr:DNA methyltransferase [Phycisphaerales bacterium]